MAIAMDIHHDWKKYGQPMYHSVGFVSPLCLVYSHDILMMVQVVSVLVLPGCATAAKAVAVQPWRAWGYPLQGPVLHSPAIQANLRKHALARACIPKTAIYLWHHEPATMVNGFTWKWVYPFCCNWNWENDEKPWNFGYLFSDYE